MEEPIKIIRYISPIVTLFNPEGSVVGIIQNESELIRVRIQIAEHGLEGYYIVFNENKFYLDQYGIFTEYPEGLYDSNEYLRKLLKVQMERRIKNENNSK